MARVMLKDVEKTYPNGFKAVNGFNLDIARQRVRGVRGAFGLRKVHHAALRRRARGDHRGHDPHRRARGQRRAAQGSRHRDGVPELRALPAHDRVREHGVRAQAAQRCRRPRSAQKVEQAAKILGIEKMLDRKPKTLSGGQRQRVAVGRAIVREPKCSCSTSRSPTSTPSCASRCARRSSASTWSSKSTTIYVTHDQKRR